MRRLHSALLRLKGKQRGLDKGVGFGKMHYPSFPYKGKEKLFSGYDSESITKEK